MVVQVSLVIRPRYVPSILSVNLKFADKKSLVEWKITIWTIFPNVNIIEFADKKLRK